MLVLLQRYNRIATKSKGGNYRDGIKSCQKAWRETRLLARVRGVKTRRKNTAKSILENANRLIQCDSTCSKCKVIDESGKNLSARRNYVWIEVEFSQKKKKLLKRKSKKKRIIFYITFTYSFRVTTWLLITYPVGNEPDPRVLVQLWNIHSPKINQRPTMIFLSFGPAFLPSYLLLLTHFRWNEKRWNEESWEGFASSVKSSKKKKKKKKMRRTREGKRIVDGGGIEKKIDKKVKHGGTLLVFPRVRASFYYLRRAAVLTKLIIRYQW